MQIFDIDFDTGRKKLSVSLYIEMSDHQCK
jgi:hypothetical protein